MMLSKSDTWVLLSICACGKKGGTLREIIMVGDYINHAVIERDELFDSIKRLHEVGLLLQTGDKFKPTRRVAIAYTKIQKETRPYLKQWTLLETFLSEAEEKEPTGTLNGLTKESYDYALMEYLQK